MATANLGSIGLSIHQRIESIPSTISGAPMWQLIDEERIAMEQYTGVTIGSVGIAEKYQPALVNLSIAAVLRAMELTGADVQSLTLGDFSVSKGAGGSLTTAADRYYQDGMSKLRQLGTKINVRRTL